MRHAHRRSGFVAVLDHPQPGRSQRAILDDLRTAILRGDVAPGTVIPLDEVAEFFGVSRIPIREALMTLVGEGLVDHRPRSVYRVARVTKAEFEEIYVVRGVLERAALAAAVRRATATDVDAAGHAHEALESALQTGDSRAYNRESRLFHLRLLAPSGMQRMLHMIEAAWNITEPCQPMAHISDEDRRLLHKDHQLMLDAFRARDAEGLLAVADAHQARLQATIAALPPDTGLFLQD